jgi:hypothetical protein
VPSSCHTGRGPAKEQAKQVPLPPHCNIATFKEVCEGSLADDIPYNQLLGMKNIIMSQIENMDKVHQSVQQARKQQQEFNAACN